MRCWLVVLQYTIKYQKNGQDSMKWQIQWQHDNSMTTYMSLVKSFIFRLLNTLMTQWQQISERVGESRIIEEIVVGVRRSLKKAVISVI